MSQRKIHLNNRKLRAELKRQKNLNMPALTWIRLVQMRFSAKPWCWVDKVFTLLPKAGKKYPVKGDGG
jgi:hypothetical protein